MDKMQTDISSLKSDVAVIKEQVNRLCKTEERKLALRQSVFIAGLSGAIALIVSFFKP